jgi:hypothetical protein
MPKVRTQRWSSNALSWGLAILFSICSHAPMSDPLHWFDHNAENPPFIKALAEVRRLAPREGWRYQHVQAIIVAIDQYTEAALGNREYFLNRPQSIGGSRNGDVPYVLPPDPH